jgi:hypothetical protein
MKGLRRTPHCAHCPHLLDRNFDQGRCAFACCWLYLIYESQFSPYDQVLFVCAWSEQRRHSTTAPGCGLETALGRRLGSEDWHPEIVHALAGSDTLKPQVGPLNDCEELGNALVGIACMS